MEYFDVIIIGGGLSGMSSAQVLGDKAVVLEASSRPGGLVKTERFGDYWFDRVLHLLYFGEEVETEKKVRKILGKDLDACLAEAWVQTASGTARFPIQFHLGNLDKETIIACLSELAELSHNPPHIEPENFYEALHNMFGKTMCNIFHWPYNRKMWKRPLEELCPQGFVWNIEPGDFETALRSVLIPDTIYPAYNSRACYPKPSEDAPQRGIEILSQRIANSLSNLRLNHRVTEVDLAQQTVTVEKPTGVETFHFKAGCCSTIPLPELLRICPQTPLRIRNTLNQMTHNRVITVALSIHGPRPENCGHWWYFADENICFTRLIFMHKFDPLMAPAEGWGLMAEIVEPAEWPLKPMETLTKEVLADIDRTGILDEGCQIIDHNCIINDPAYAVFSNKNQDLINEARSFFEENGLTLLGRYGKWSYMSMAQVLSDGYAHGKRILQDHICCEDHTSKSESIPNFQSSCVNKRGLNARI